MKIASVLACFALFVIPLRAASQNSIAIDSQGNVWRTGQNLPVALTANAFQNSFAATVCGTQQLSPFVTPTALPCPHAYVTKQDAAGNVLYATFLGGTGADGGIAVTTDAQGNAYVTGFTNSPDFPVTAGVIQPRNAGPLAPRVVLESIEPFGPKAVLPGGDVFLTKFSPDGTVVYSTLLGGSGSDVPVAIGVDPTGAISISGTTESADFPVTANSLSHQNGNANFFVRLNSQATGAIWSTYSDPSVLSFDIDAQGNAFLTGNSGGPYVTKVNTATGKVAYTVSLAAQNAKFTGVGVAISVEESGAAVVGVSPAPVPSHLLIPQPVVFPLGPSFLLTVSPDGAAILREMDLSNAQFDQLLQDSAGNIYAFGHGTGALPVAASLPLLSAPCSSSGGSFVVESDAAGSVIAATYLRQGGAPEVVNAPGKLSAFRPVSGTVSPADLSATAGINFGCLGNLASGQTGPGIAQGEIFTLFGSNLGPSQPVAGAPDSSGRYPLALGGAQVSINGKAAPLLMVQAGEIHGVVPFAFMPQVATVQVQYLSQLAPALDEPNSLNPGIFVINGQGAILNQDGTANTPSNPARLGSVISIFGTGEGQFSSPVTDGGIIPLPPPYIVLPETPQVTIAGVNGTVLWSGAAPQLIAGVTQINVRIPSTLPAGTNPLDVPVVVVPPGVFSPPVRISVTP